MNEIELKQKLRTLKKLERRIRCRYLRRHPQSPLLWDGFFSTKTAVRSAEIKYPFYQLLTFERSQRKQIFEEYLYMVFFQHHQEEGITVASVQDPTLLSFLGLPPYASLADIKKRFRELAHRYHPDKGGDSEKMIKLLEVYHSVFPKKRR
jgi:hypothetical protein